MEQNKQQNGLRQKVRLGEVEAQARTTNLGRALRLTLAKVGEEDFDLPLAVIGFASKLCGNGELEAAFKGPNLLMLLDGPQGARGAVLLDEILVSGLIQQQTMGKLKAANGVEPRPMTPTDAAICAPLVDALFERAALLPDTPADRQLLEGYRFGAGVADTRLLLMALEGANYHLVELTIDMAAGTRQGKMTLVLPQITEKTQPAPHQNSEETPVQEPVPTMADSVMGLKAELPVHLARLILPLSHVSTLQVDQVIDLGQADFTAVNVMTRAGKLLAKGNLGKTGEQRAVKLVPRKPTTVLPQRRATDRGVLALPPVEENGFSALTLSNEQPDLAAAPLDANDLPSLPDLDAASEPGALPDLPDMSDLSELPELDALPDLPDFSDLPELA